MNSTSQRRQSNKLCSWRKFGVALAVCAFVFSAKGQWARIDSSFPQGSGPESYVKALAVDQVGRTLISGPFTNVSGILQSNLARINMDGTMDPSFRPRILGSPVRIQPLPSGRVFISGSVTQVEGSPVPGIARLLEDGSRDPSFTPPLPPSSSVSFSGQAAPDGSVWITGGFSNLAGVAINGVARLLSTGALDPGFHSPFSSGQSITVLGIQGDGKAIVSGSFSNVAGYALKHLARLNTNGSVDPSFVSALAPAERVSRMLVQANGQLVASVSRVSSEDGYEMSVSPKRLVRLNSNGSLDSNYNVSFEFPGLAILSSSVTMAEEPNGTLLVWGNFLRVNGVSRGRLARLLPDGSLDQTFDVAFASEWMPLGVAPGAGGAVLVGGAFGGLGDQFRPNLLRLVPGPGGSGLILMSVSDMKSSRAADKVLVPVIRKGGLDQEQTIEFLVRDGTAVSGVDYSATNGTVRFTRGERSQFISISTYQRAGSLELKSFEVCLKGDAVGSLTNTVVTLIPASTGSVGPPDTNFVVSIDNPVTKILPVPTGHFYVAGSFTNVNGQFCPNITRLQPDGGRDTTFNRLQAISGEIRDMVVDSSGCLLVAGYFTYVDGILQPGLARFNWDGSLDQTFVGFKNHPTNSYGGASMCAVTILEDQAVLCSGDVPAGDYNESTGLWKLKPDGTVDPSFTNASPISFAAYYLQPAKGGGFYQVTRGLGATLTRSTGNGKLDNTFLPPADRDFTWFDCDFQQLEDGRISVQGPFSSLAGLPGNLPLWRLNPDGSLDSSFTMSNSVSTLGVLESIDAHHVDKDGRVLLAATFSNGANVRLARLHADGSPDWSFDPGTGFKASSQSGYPHINALEETPDGGWLAAGDFGGYDGFTQKYLVKIRPDLGSRPQTFFFGSTNISIPESDTVLSFEVRRSGDAATPASVTVASANATAVAGQDYVPVLTNLVFEPGEWSKTVYVRTLQDSIVENTEQFTLSLTNLTAPFVLAQPSLFTVTIQNEDASIEFTAPNFLAAEEDGFANVAVKWGGAFTNELEARIQVIPVTGQAGDLGVSSVTVKCSGRLTPTNWFRIPIKENQQKDPCRIYRLELQGQGNVTPVQPATASLSIEDGDFTTTPARGVAGVVYAVTGSLEGGVYLVGDFTGVHGVSRNRVARLLPDGEVDPAFNPGTGPDGVVHAAAVQADGKLVIAGWFTNVSGFPRAGLARLNQDGALDVSFDPGMGATSTNGLAVIGRLLPWQDGSLFVGGAFTHFNNRYSPNVARLEQNGSIDLRFLSPFRPTSYTRPDPFREIESLSDARTLIEQNGSILAGGSLYLTTGGGTFLVRISPAGLVQKVLAGSTNMIYSVADLGNGQLLIGSGSTSSQLAIRKIGTNGVADPSFSTHNLPTLPCDSSIVHQLAIQPDGRILCGALLFKPAAVGPLHSLALDTAVILRLMPDGRQDSTFRPLVCLLPLFPAPGGYWSGSYPILGLRSFEPPIPTAFMCAQPDDVLVLAGSFEAVNGEVRRRIARVGAGGALRGILTLKLQRGPVPRLLLPDEVETPYLLETSSDLQHWYPWLANDYPWWGADLSIPANEPNRFFRARVQE